MLLLIMLISRSSGLPLTNNEEIIFGIVSLLLLVIFYTILKNCEDK